MKGAYVVFLAFVVCACDTSNGDQVTLADAKAAAKSAAGASAVDCGTIDADDARADANCCFATNLAQSKPAFALYKIQGIDTIFAKAVALEADGHVAYFAFEANLGDFDDPIEGRITEEPCNDAALAENACSNEADLPFNCSQ